MSTLSRSTEALKVTWLRPAPTRLRSVMYQRGQAKSSNFSSIKEVVYRVLMDCASLCGLAAAIELGTAGIRVITFERSYETEDYQHRPLLLVFQKATVYDEHI